MYHARPHCKSMNINHKAETLKKIKKKKYIGNGKTNMYIYKKKSAFNINLLRNETLLQQHLPTL